MQLDMSLPAPDIASELVDAIAAYHARHSVARTPAPWGPPLPRGVSRGEVIEHDRSTAKGTALAVTDHPDVPCQRVFIWPQTSATLVVTGPSGSGKTTAAQSIVQSLQGDETAGSVHVVAANLDRGLELWRLAHTNDPGASLAQPGSVTTARDGVMLATVLNWLSFDAVGDHLVVVDDADLVLEILEQERLTAIGDQLLGLLRKPSPGVRVLTTWTRAPRGIVERASACIELWGDGAESLDRRVPRRLSAGTGIPGRCLVIGGDTTAVGQILTPNVANTDHVEVLPHWRPLPTQVSLAECEQGSIGVAGFDHGPLHIDPRRPLLVSARKVDALQRALLTLLSRCGGELKRCVVSSRRLDPDCISELGGQPMPVEVVQPAELQVLHVIDPETLVVVVGDVAALNYEAQQAVIQQITAPAVGAAAMMVALTSAELMSGYGEPMASIRQMPHQLHFAPHASELTDLISHEDRHLLSATSRPPMGRALYVDGGETRVVQVATRSTSKQQASSHSGGPTGFSRAVVAG